MSEVGLGFGRLSGRGGGSVAGSFTHRRLGNQNFGDFGNVFRAFRSSLESIE